MRISSIFDWQNNLLTAKHKKHLRFKDVKMAKPYQMAQALVTCTTSL